MSGGIFPGRPFRFNIKCIIFTMIIAGGYWWAPQKNLWILLFCLWWPYVALAWYDYSYNCEDKMQYTLFPFGKYIFLPFKPKEYQQTYYNLPKEDKDFIDYLDHIYTYTIVIAIMIILINSHL